MKTITAETRRRRDAEEGTRRGRSRRHRDTEEDGRGDGRKGRGPQGRKGTEHPSVRARGIASTSARPPLLGWGEGQGVRVPRRHCTLHGWELLPAMPHPTPARHPAPDLGAGWRAGCPLGARAGVRAVPRRGWCRWIEIPRWAATTPEGHPVPLKGILSRLDGLRPRSPKTRLGSTSAYADWTIPIPNPSLPSPSVPLCLLFRPPTQRGSALQRPPGVAFVGVRIRRWSSPRGRAPPAPSASRGRGGRPRSARCPGRRRSALPACRHPSHTGSACGNGSRMAG